MIPVQIQIGEVIVVLTEERAMTTERMKRSLAETERHIVEERATLNVLQTEVADKKKELQAALARKAAELAKSSSWPNVAACHWG